MTKYSVKNTFINICEPSKNSYLPQRANTTPIPWVESEDEKNKGPGLSSVSIDTTCSPVTNANISGSSESSSSFQDFDMSACSSIGDDCENFTKKFSSSLVSLCSTTRHLVVDGRTSIMVRNIPCSYTPKQIFDELSGLGFEIVYINAPQASHVSSTKGFAFVELATPGEAKRFYYAINQYTFLQNRNSKKRVVSSWCRTQGLVQNLQLLQSTLPSLFSLHSNKNFRRSKQPLVINQRYVATLHEVCDVPFEWMSTKMIV